MADSSFTADVDWAVLEIRKGDSADLAAVQLLIEDGSPEVDATLLAIFADRKTRFDVAVLAARILVERDRDRDPAFIHDFYPGVKEFRERTSKPARMIQRFAPYPPVGAHRLGFARLNSLSPVWMYTNQLEEKFFGSRLGAAAALGDTGDLAALDPLARALADPHRRVRETAADSVRRLRRAGAGEVLPTHPVRAALITCLADRRQAVRVAAARALGSMGDLEPLRTYRAGLGWWAWRRRRDVDEVLRGEIPPLPKIWPGDESI